MVKSVNLFSIVQSFFLVFCRSTRGLSENTIASYRDGLRLFFCFASQKLKKRTSKISLDDCTQELVLDFLSSSQKNRGNSGRTRNQRLALLRSFFSYVLANDPERAEHYRRIIEIPFKRTSERTMAYLEVNEMRALLNAVDKKSRLGLRDYAILFLMYNTGARVQEVCDLKLESLNFENTPTVTLFGKGQKERVVPIWKNTKLVLEKYLKANHEGSSLETPLFYNPWGEALSRHAVVELLARHVEIASPRCPSLKRKKISPHTIRHTTAMHLLQSGVDLTVIKEWLGHCSINTSHKYVTADLKMKQQALSKKKSPQIRKELSQILKANKDVVLWLKELS